MKRFLIVLSSLVLLCSIISCAKKDDNKNNYEKIISQLEKDDSYQISDYNSHMIKDIVSNCENAGLNFEGEINHIKHFVDAAKGEFIYVYEFEFQKDADLFYEKHGSTWDYAKTYGTVVVFGTSSNIENLKI